jgi:hypothetical protein
MSETKTEPTEEMVSAGKRECAEGGGIASVYHAMLAAAPNTAPEGELARLKDAVIFAAGCICHWHDAHDGGMIVSGDKVRELWQSLRNLKDYQSTTPQTPIWRG